MAEDQVRIKTILFFSNILNFMNEERYSESTVRERHYYDIFTVSYEKIGE